MLELLGISSFAYLLTVAKPSQWLFDKIIKLIIWLYCKITGFASCHVRVSKIKYFILELVTCSMCTGFWVGLLSFGTLWQAGLVSLLARLIEAIYDSLPKHIDI